MEQAFDIEAARASYRQRQEAKRASRLERWAHAERQAQQAVALIVERYRPLRVVQWGSVLKPERFTEVSDIDIAVEGIHDQQLWSDMERDLEKMLTFPLDLVPLDRIRPEFRDQILARGKVVYERPQ